MNNAQNDIIEHHENHIAYACSQVCGDYITYSVIVKQIVTRKRKKD